MATQPPITAFFSSKKRRATDVLERESKIYKGDPTLVKFGPVRTEKILSLSEHTTRTVQKPIKKLSKPNHIEGSKNKDICTIFQNKKASIAAENSDVAIKTENGFEKCNEKPIGELGTTRQVADIKPTISAIISEKPRKVQATPSKISKEVEDMKIPTEETTPRKGLCDAKNFMISKSPYRPECKSETPVKFFRLESKAMENETTPAKTPRTPGSIMKTLDRPVAAVKKCIRFEDEGSSSGPEKPEEDTDDIIKAANDLVEKLKNKSRNLSDLSKPKPGKKPEVMTAGLLKKKLARTAKLAELKSSLNRLGQHATELIKMEKKKKEADEPKIRSFSTIEVDVPRSPHKGALSSPIKSPAKPAFERFASLIHRTGPTSAGGVGTLPLPLGYQKLLDLFTATDTVCSMMLNRGEIITFKKVQPAVQELTRQNMTERHLAQMAAVLPSAFEFRQQKLRNFGSTSKIDRYQLVIDPVIHASDTGSRVEPNETTNLIIAADCKKMTPRILLQRKEAFAKNLLNRTLDKHDEFLASLDPPLHVVRSQLTRWHPNFQVDLLPDVAPICLPEPPTVAKGPTSAKDVLERAKKMLDANSRLKSALEVASLSTEVPSAPSLTQEVKAAVDKKVAAHDPLKGISKSLLDKIRAKQAAKALEAMRVTPADEQELMLLSKLPDTARILRGLFVDNQKSVLPWENVVEKVLFSAKRTSSKGEVEKTLRRLISELPNWLSLFVVRGVEYLKLDRAAAFGPITEKLEKLVAEKRRSLS